MYPRTAILAAVLALYACSSSSTLSSHGMDASNQDVVTATDVVDASDIPAGPPLIYTCRPCLHDGECGDGGSCIEFDPTHSPGLLGCAVACSNPGGSCTAPVVASCQTDNLGRNVCVPTDTCITVNSHEGAACTSGMCSGRYAVCASYPASGHPSVCLAPCTRDADCEDGYGRCQMVPIATGGQTLACVPDQAIGPDACGVAEVNSQHIGAPCAAATDCPATGMSCISGIDPLLHGYCSIACGSDADCGAGASCLQVGTQGMRCVPSDCVCGAAPQNACLDQALEQAMWTRCNLFFSQSDLDAFGPSVVADRFRLPIFDRVHHDWVAGLRWARDLGPSLDTVVTSLSGGIAAAAGLRASGDPTSVSIPAPITAPSGSSPLATATAALITATGGSPDMAAITADAADVPMALQQALAAVLTAETAVALARDQGLLFVTDPSQIDHLYAIAPHFVLPTNQTTLPDFTSDLDLGAVLGDVVEPIPETLALAATIESIDWTPFQGMMGPAFDEDTPVGRVIVRDGAAQTYTATDYARLALVVDLGGDDRYEASVAANADSTNSVSVSIDLAGNDTYAYAGATGVPAAGATLVADAAGRLGGAYPLSLSETPRQGAGRLGVGLLYDFGGGADTYLSLRESQGFGALGIGGLYDDGGDDVYAVEAGGQGAAESGIGVLVDAGGTDHYTTWAYAEGFGYVQGVGLLYDRAGDDTYNSVVAPVLYGSPQDATSNESFTQGAGFGRNAQSLPDGINMAGGMGVLRDATGNDNYTTGVFGQGTGYWSGMGLLLDGAGNDDYEGRWYVQGGVAHFAYGALIDGGGQDVHNATSTRENMTGGAGHDFSLGILLALGSDDDIYHVPNLALGAGNANGAGIFADEGGNDLYDAASTDTVGNASTASPGDTGRESRPTVGIFLDGDGMDTYTRTPVAPLANNTSWLQRVDPSITMEVGVGTDATSTPLGF